MSSDDVKTHDSICGEDMKMYEEYLNRLNQRQKLVGEMGFHNYPKRNLEHLCNLNVYQSVQSWRKTKIICAIGKSSNSEETMLEMMRTGMNIARLNVTSLGYEETTRLVKSIRKMAAVYFAETQLQVSVAIDVAAPTARIHKLLLLSGTDEIKEGQSIWFVGKEGVMDPTTYNIIVLGVEEFPLMIRYFLPRSRLYIDDGVLTVIVRENYGNSVRCLVEQGGRVELNSTVNFVWSQNFLYHCAENYIKTLKYLTTADVDMVMVSFIRDVQSFNYIREKLGNSIPIIMKIENYIAPNILEQLIDAADGVLIARGLLGIDLPIEKVFVLQKQIIAKTLHTTKPVFVGFQMLESMVTKPRPTRAEATDVANAVLANVDALVLGKETAKGNFVVKSIDVMNKISLEAEVATCNFTLYQILRSRINLGGQGEDINYTNSACLSAVQASYNSRAKAIVVVTENGLSAFHTAALRPECLILTVCRLKNVVMKCNLYKSIYAMWYDEPEMQSVPKEIDAQLIALLRWACDIHLLAVNDTFVCLTGRTKGKGSTRTVRILTVPDELENFEMSQAIMVSLSSERLK